MTGLERNSDIVEMASYAPLLANSDYVNWTPDAIWFDNASSYGTPSYQVQTPVRAEHGRHRGADHARGGHRAAARHPGRDRRRDLGDPSRLRRRQGHRRGRRGAVLGRLLRRRRAVDAERPGRGVARNLGRHRRRVPADVGPHRRAEHRGQPELVELHARAQRAQARRGRGLPDHVRVARQRQLLLVEPGRVRQHAVADREVDRRRQTSLASSTDTITTGQTYRIKVEVKGRRIVAWLDGRKVNDFVDNSNVVEPLYQVMTRDEDSGEVVLEASTRGRGRSAPTSGSGRARSPTPARSRRSRRTR